MMSIPVLLRASLVIGVVCLVHAAFAPRMSAAMRHFLWTLVVAALLLLPVLSFVLPAWRILEQPASIVDRPSPVANRPSFAVVGPSVIVSLDDPEPVSWSFVLVVVCAAVTAVLLIRLVAEHFRLRQLVRRMSTVTDPEWADLLNECAGLLGVRHTCRLRRSRDEVMPMTFGIGQPTILIPASADTWPTGRRRAVLLHELAHVSRRDCLTQTLAAVACAFYWMLPPVWWVARRLRVERELACDDQVLTTGTEAREYAGDLLDLAYTLGGRQLPAMAVSMAGSPQIEGRMLAVLDEARNRTSPAWRVRGVGVVLMLAMLVPVSAATTTTGPTALPIETDPAPSLGYSQRGAPPTAQKPGTWEIRATADLRTVHLRLSEGDGSYGSTIDIDQLSGLSTAMLSGAGGSAQFTLRRDPGAFQFEGIFRNGVGAGTYTFVPDPGFPEAMVTRGFPRPTTDEQYLLARANFGFALLDELTAQKYDRPDLAQLIRAVQHGVTLIYLRDMGQLGYRLKTVDGLITLRDHGVSPQYVRELAAEGLKGLTLAALGYGTVPLDTAIQLRNHGVSPEYVRDLRALGYQNLWFDALIRLRNHGVSPEYVRELNALGYASLTIDQLVDLRNYGVSPERIRSANARAGTRLTVDALKNAAANGWR